VTGAGHGIGAASVRRLAAEGASVTAADRFPQARALFSRPAHERRRGNVNILGFNRVELVVREDQIDKAVEQFNEVLGLRLPKPHAIEGAPVLSATDFGGSIEIVAPVGGQGSFAAKLERGPGQIGPLVWEVADVDEARTWLTENGYTIIYEYDSRKGNADEQAHAVHQLILDPAQWFGFNVTLMRRYH
jgi:hypothetical protein